MGAALRLGTQGWNHAAWVGPFYPPGTRARDMLRLYARAFGTVEVDSTFYAIPAEVVVRSWRESVPEGFLFALKVPQEITHERRLVDVEGLLHRFCSRASVLGTTLGPLVVQLSPVFHPTAGNREALRAFVEMLPIRYHWVIEFRHPGWLDAETFELLRLYNVALALADSRWIKRGLMLEMAIEPPAAFTYVRWMGERRRLMDFSRVQLDRERELSAWCQALESLGERVGTVFGYFNNQYQGHAPESAREMQRRLGLEVVAPELLQEQVELF